ncbi:P-type conjugative transfer protein TrbL [Bordetella petrii]|uniref:Conjugal transfer protein TrbL n=1 Tax=Bordetella petrii (strain ATCC BAA-461 / DSM 12804 / CCUG 43448 / CIP 107267 / Se-1111R) TaxID=340100 RepID=A9IF63_BORPD|nr:P-type conjugative transfer protein TrbL [Bordetella petrii]MBO1112192.1 P-type conjugative transfer protein TrbL [Bordetella petrii]MBO9354729.1 P-type conjugative transfer protein TrbL [Bordetella petrii]CAP44974.1 conjugal transfer protein TrbL [Bordetella petrii]
MNDLAIIDRFTNIFSRYIDSGFGLVNGEVAFLSATLVVIDMTLAGLWWAMDHGQNDVLARLIKKVLYVGVFAFILGNFNWLSGIVFRSLSGLGLMASGSSLTIAEFLQPGRLAQVGVDTAAPLLERVGDLSGFTSVFANLDTIVVLLLAWLVVILSFFVLAIQLFVTLIEFKLTTLAGFVLVPFALWGKTAFLAEKVLGNVISAGIKVLVLAVIVGISTLVFNDFRTAMGPEPTLDDAAAVMLASLAMLGLGIFGPSIATGLVSGAPQLGAGAVAGTALGTAGVATAGAVAGATVAGGAARMAGGGVRAATSMASGARKAYVEGASFSGKTGWRATAAGLKDVARAGASAAGRGVKSRVMGAGRASPAGGSTVAPSAPPAWAKRAQARQRATQGATMAAHAVRSGDAGGNGLIPSLRDDS